MMKKYKVLVCDDQKISSKYFESIVINSDEFELLYSVSSASLVDVYCLRYDIDLIILDVVMSDGSNGLDTAELIKKMYPQIKIIIVTSMPEVSYISKAKSIGVESFWYKEISDISLIDVMKRTISGESVYPQKKPVLYIGNAKSDDFTEMELQILREMTTGASNTEIAEHFHISIQTVKNHITHMLSKSGYSNRTKLAIEARVSGIVIK